MSEDPGETPSLYFPYSFKPERQVALNSLASQNANTNPQTFLTCFRSNNAFSSRQNVKAGSRKQKYLIFPPGTKYSTVCNGYRECRVGGEKGNEKWFSNTARKKDSQMYFIDLKIK